jgi:hypothetical protein
MDHPVHNKRMEISLTLDDDAHQFASIYANAKGMTLDRAINELIRRAETTPQSAPDIRRSASGLPMFPPTGRVLTSQMVKEIESELE